MLVFPGPWPLALPQALAPNWYLPVLGPSLSLPALASNLYYKPWLPTCIYRPCLTILLLVRGLSLHIPTLSPWFEFVFTVQAWNLYYRSRTLVFIYLIIVSSSSGSRNSSSSNLFEINTTNICIPILVT